MGLPLPLQAGGIAFGVIFIVMMLLQWLFWLAIYVGLCLVAIFAYDKLVRPPGVDAARVAELERDVAELRYELERKRT